MRFVTGLSGFLGSHLKAKLGDVTSIPHADIKDYDLPSYDYFYFLSAYGNLAHQNDEGEVFKANIEDLLSILQKSRKTKFKSFVYVSTSSVKLRTQTTYSRTKKAAEEILLAFMEKHNAPVCIIRPFSVTGVGEQKEHLIPTLIDAAYTGKTINLVPWASHDFIDVEDIVDGILSLSNNHARGIFELGTGKSYSNAEVMAAVEYVTQKKINVNFVDSMRSYDNKEWVSTNFKARGYGWLPKKTLEQSIQEMVGAYAAI